MSIDIRHPSDERLDAMENDIRVEAERLARDESERVLICPKIMGVALPIVNALFRDVNLPGPPISYLPKSHSLPSASTRSEQRP